MTRKKTIISILINILFIAVFVGILTFTTKLRNEMSINLYLGESHAGQKNIAQLFYSDDSHDWKKNTAITVTFEDNVIPYSVGEIDFSNNLVRIDPFNAKEDFSIVKVELVYGQYTVHSMTGKELKGYIRKPHNLKYKVHGEALNCTVKNSDGRLIMKKAFSKMLYKYNLLIEVAPCVIIIFLYLLWGIAEIKMLQRDKEKKKILQWIARICATLFIAVGVVAVYVLQYFESHFGQVPLGQLIYHLHTPLEGTDISSYSDVIWLGVGLVLGVVALLQVLYWLSGKKGYQYGLIVWSGILGIGLMGYSGVKASFHFDIPGYYEYTHSSTTLYEDEYVDGRSVNITFPEKKRNLIYIFLESMEITYADTTSGGGMSDNYIPELTKLAQENGAFSDGTGLNGAYQVSGATYTMGALAAQTSGTSINETMVSNDTLNSTWDSENNYLPGVWSIGDVLAEQGYNQEFLIGSDGKFAGRTSYFRGHGNYDVEDYYSAIEKERIPEDYKVWWGYEDAKLFDFAKEDLKKLAAQDEPFNMTMLTVDTHFTNGYVCDQCGDQFEQQYSNVIACSSKQVAEFVEWIRQQDFYDNTTIVLAGDHLTPDSYYIINEGAEGFDRRTYFTIINPADGKVSDGTRRTYTTLDLYPTTLSSLGVEIEGSRLGLGVDLYSGEQTLAEKYGVGYLDTELLKNSDYYSKKLLYKEK